MSDRITAALVRVLHIDPAVAFATHPELRVQRTAHPDDDLPQPGFVGSRYQPGGLLLIGMNPANGGAVIDPHKVEEMKALVELRDGLITRQQAMARIESGKMHRPYWRNVVGPIVQAAEINLGGIAHLNLFPFRTAGQKLPRALAMFFRPYLDALIEALEPRAIVACGVGAGEGLMRADVQPAVTVKRTIGDRSQHPDFANAVDKVRALMVPGARGR